MATGKYTLIGVPGYGSAIVEAALTLTGLDHEIEDIGADDLGPGSTRLGAINPLGQVPTLLMPDGRPMTESAAMILHLADVAPAAGLAPAGDDPLRPVFLHWLIVLVAALYPTFTFGDEPARWVSDQRAARELRHNTDRSRQDLWRHVESAIAPDPWFLGRRFSALDLYAAVMTRWRPRRPWFADHCPKLYAVAAAADRLPPLGPVWTRHDFAG